MVSLRYEIGLDNLDDGSKLAELYEWARGLPSYSPERHELAAHMLLMAVRREWEEADRCREIQRNIERRERKRKT